MEINAVRLLNEAFIGVTLMTAFSYALSAILTECFREPELLDILLRPNVPESKRKHSFLGWSVHFATAIVFALAYEAYWHYTKFAVDWKNTALLGVISGFFGILCWKAAYALAKKKPRIDFKGFYIQLVVAHVLFAIGAAATYLMWIQ